MSDDGTPSVRARIKGATGLAAACWLGAAAVYLATEAIAALAFSPPYDYARNYISDLGVPVCGTVFDGRAICSPLHALMNIGFIIQAPLFLGGALAISSRIHEASKYLLIGFAAMDGIGLLLIGVFPESVTVPPSPTMGLHVLGAFLSIFGGNATALTSAFAFRGLELPRVHRLASIIFPLVAAASLTMLIVARDRGIFIVVPDAVWERLSVYSITAWEVLSAICVLRRRT